jgi:hypothetical protein
MAHELPTKRLVSLFSELLGGYPNPEGDTPPGPWDPYIRKAIRRVVALGPDPLPWLAVALNPQPLPPKAAFAVALAQEVVDRALLVQEIGEALPQAGQERGIIIVGGLVNRFIDDCGNDRLWRKRPFPPPPPRGHGDDKLSALELLLMGAVFEQGARGAANEQVQQKFAEAGSRLAEVAAARL